MAATAHSVLRLVAILTGLSIAAASLSIALVTPAPAAESGGQGHLSVTDIARRAIERRAVEAVIWCMPAVNYDLMLQEMLTKTDGKVNQMIYWGRPLDWTRR